MSCSNNDDSEEQLPTYADEIEILEHSWEKAGHHVFMGEDRWQVRSIAIVENKSNETKKGRIRFVINEANGETYLNSDLFTIQGNSTIDINKVENNLLSQVEIDAGYNRVEFVEDNSI